MSAERLVAVYRLRATRESVAARAEALALEQSVELPRAALRDERVRAEVAGRVAAIDERGEDLYEARVELACETVGDDAGQLLNMLFGNSSLQPDVALVDVQLPRSLATAFGGPRFGVVGLRALAGVQGRPLAASALKPQGLDAASLAALAATFAEAGIDVIKDDHGLADQRAAPFAVRVAAVTRALDAVAQRTGRRAVYAPSLTGDAGALARQLELARAAGVSMVMLAPMVSGVSMLSALARGSGMALLAHPSMAGCTAIAAPVLLGTLFRLFGADATIFPAAGGRFAAAGGEGPRIAAAAAAALHGLEPTMPVPAGGLSLERVPEVRARYGIDAMLLAGGDLIGAADVAARTRAFVEALT